MSTVLPRNLATVRFYFKTQFGAATIRGRLDFEGGVYRDRHSWHSFTMWRDFEGSVNWDEFAETCGDILRAAGFRGVATFQGNTVYIIIGA